MEYINFLNIEYLLLRLRDLFAPFFDERTYNAFPDTITFTLGQLALLGVAITVVLILALIYIQIKLIIVEHEGFHEKEEHEEEAAHDKEVDSKNPRWERVMALASSSNESDWRRAIVEADIMLNLALADKGYKGETVGDQFANANPLQFTTLDLARAAHQVRNDIAHGGEGFHLSEREVRATIDNYARVFEEFGLL